MRIVRNMTAPPPAGGAAPCEDVRCGCGSLLARVVDGAIELKCRRCKRLWRLAPGAAGARWTPAGAP
ncbi:MAG TPA: hypothetical protein VF841_11765 [Anaeromyxobacter sp.]